MESKEIIYRRILSSIREYTISTVNLKANVNSPETWKDNKDHNQNLYGENCNKDLNKTFNIEEHIKGQNKTNKNAGFKIMHEIFEIYTNSTTKIIRELVVENVKLKNELRLVHNFIQLLHNKTEEMTHHISSPSPFHNLSYIDCETEADTDFDANVTFFKIKIYSILDSLNLVREKLVEGNIKLKLRENYINKKKLDIRNNSHNCKLATEMSTGLVLQRWMPDFLVKNCHSCTRKFGMFLSKYHCYVCGDVFCTNCLMSDLLLPFKEKVSTCFNCNLNVKLKNIK